ncbi:MAG TPA: right-handed parallel beta-helix repeat-containing protein [Longimicrobium sp.]|nr:right-handed parallel beta-helix repeat-containing protein [Longimicrobium sp.]
MRHWNQADGGSRRFFLGGWAALVLAAAVAACDRAPTEPGERLARPGGVSMTVTPACAGGGGTAHAGDSITTAVAWGAGGNPHQVSQTVVVDAGGQLVIYPGAVICFQGGTGIRARNGGRVHARGSNTATILMTAYDPANGWSGVELRDNPPVWNSYLTNVVMEHVASGSTAVTSLDQHPVLIDSAVVRQTGQALRLLAPFSRVSRSRVDTTTDGTRPAVAIGDSVIWQRVDLRGAAGVGVRVEGTVGVYLLGGRIIGSGGVGLQVPSRSAVQGAAPVRVTGGAVHGAELSAGAFAVIYPNLTDQDSLLGNARDTLYMTGDTLTERVIARAVLPWHVRAPVYVESGGEVLAQPGARLSFDAGTGIELRWALLQARGTPAAPVLFTADDPALGWSGMEIVFGDSSYLTNVRIEHVDASHTAVYAAFTPLVIDSAVFRQVGNAVQMWGGGASISRTRVDTTLAGGWAVSLAYDTRIESTLIRASAGTGLLLWDTDVQVVSCEVRDAGWAGIQMFYETTVHDCNLVNNAGPGIDNMFGTTADVTNVWWGDAAGPNGTNGDGAAGDLNYTPWRTTPFVLPYVP